MIFGILKDGVRSAFVRIVRTIVYIIIFLVVLYIVGLISSSKASALVYKGTSYSGYTTANVKSGQITPNGTTQQTNLIYKHSTPYTTIDSDFVGFRWNLFSINFIPSTDNLTDSCTGTITSNGSNIGSSGSLSIGWACPNNYHEPLSQSEFFSLSARIIMSDNGVETEYQCWTSSEYENTFICPNIKTQQVAGLNVYLRYKVNNTFTYSLDMTGLRFVLDNDSSALLNQNQQYYEYTTQQNTQIINNQNSTNTYITDNSITGSTTQSTTALTGISAEFNDILNGWGGEWSSLTHVILEPINVILYAFDGNTTCQPIVLQLPYMQDKSITLPCLSGIYNQYFGTFISVFVIGISGLYGYRTIIYVIRTIKDVLDAENDKIEVIDL